MDPRLDMLADLGVMLPGLPVLLPVPPPSPISSLVTEPRLWDLGASEDFLLLRQADRGSFILSFFVTNFPAGKYETIRAPAQLSLPERTLPRLRATSNISGSIFSTELVRPSDLQFNKQMKNCGNTGTYIAICRRGRTSSSIRRSSKISQRSS